VPEIHVPKLEEHDEEPEAPATEAHAIEAPFGARRPRARTLLKLALEVALIGTGVFLGLAGEQWRENARHRELAHDALRRFRSEVEANRQSVVRVKDYHVEMQRRIREFLAADAKSRPSHDVNLRGIEPAGFEHTAWDLALTTQSLAYIDSDLAFALARIYNLQQGYAELSRGVLQAMYIKPASQDLEGFFQAVDTYYGDVVLMEPKLMRMYDEILPRLDRALGGAAAH
jgi:hypothetical protein